MFEIRTDENITTRNQSTLITPEDAFNLHEWPEDFSNVDEPITVAVMDSGIDKQVAEDHSWFENAEITKTFDATSENKPDQDNVGHGTGVASIIARATPKVELYSVRIFSNQAATGFNTIRDAYLWLTRRADEIDIVNMSWGSSQDVREIDNLHEKLVDLNVADVVAAGNTGSDGGSPATAGKAFSVGALNEDAEPTRFSSWDPDQGNPEVAAVGKDVKMARVNDTNMGQPLNENFVKASGTSFAAPYTAAGYVNALYQKRMNWDGNFVRSAKDIPGTKKDGAGILKLNEALNTGDAGDPKNKVGASSWNFRGNDTIWIEADWLEEKDTNATLINETKDYVDIRIEK